MLLKNYTLPEDNGHTVSFSELGNPQGPAILVFHGGPGGKSKPAHAGYYDLARYRVIMYDQRGCGKSMPAGRLAGNTTADLLRDAERIRDQLGIHHWFLSGSSWGATLALLYAIQHPGRVRGLLLSAVFLADGDSDAWAMKDANGAARLVPDVWARRMELFQRFNVHISSQYADLLEALERASPGEQKEIVSAVQNWDGNLLSSLSAISYKSPEEVTDAEVQAVRIFLHYQRHLAFIPDKYILTNAPRICDIPAILVHGRYDLLCPLQKVYELVGRLSKAELVIATSSGHQFTAEGKTIRQMAYDRFLERHTAAQVQE